MATYLYKQTIAPEGKFRTRFEPLRSHHMQLYTHDMGTAQKALANLKRVHALAPTPEAGRAESAPGLDALSARLQAAAGTPGADAKIVLAEAKTVDPNALRDACYVHEAMAGFHQTRANAHMEEARVYGDMALATAPDPGPDERDASAPDGDGDDDADPTPSAPPPSLFDRKPAGDHKPEDALKYHSDLFGDALGHAAALHAQARALGEAAARPGAPALDHTAMTCLERQYDHMNRLADLHGRMIESFNDYIKRRADVTFQRDNDPIGHDPETGQPSQAPSTANPYAP